MYKSKCDEDNVRSSDERRLFFAPVVKENHLSL